MTEQLHTTGVHPIYWWLFDAKDNMPFRLATSEELALAFEHSPDGVKPASIVMLFENTGAPPTLATFYLGISETPFP